ncbi:zinc finger protein 33B-like [Topomyia yanbarensis]|uniref:zinc finger protein 33B-like n=1 Tax=Topomyia yanbarensis TaxID=2498891 RepID=UPI00273A86FA|nr:zinc finger protein 33B-like [Topomyia yanbarensis]XP_058814381.1 zinc finger protein 33B-like [Topomyia yanbarensis]
MSSRRSEVAGLASASNECRLLLNVARYYGVISKIVDILDHCLPPPVIDCLQVIHTPETQSIVICYGEIIVEECLSEPETALEQDIARDEKLVLQEATEEPNTMIAPQAIEELSGETITEDHVEEMFCFIEQPENVADALEEDDLGFDVIVMDEKVEPVEMVDGVDDCFNVDSSDDETGVSEYYVEYLQEENSIVEEATDLKQTKSSVEKTAVIKNNGVIIRYKCQFVTCDKRYQFAGEYDEHLRRCHAGIIKPPIELQCKHIECTALFNDTYKLYLHHRNHKMQLKAKPKTLFRCDPCQSTFDTTEDLKKHLRKHGTVYKKGVKTKVMRLCEFCTEILDPKINEYNVHCLNVHGHALYSCFVCGKNFHLMVHLSEHIKSGHDAVTTQQHINQSLWRMFHIDGFTIKECRICFRLFASPKSDRLHREHHLKELSLTCTNCGGKHYESHCTEPRPKYGNVYEKVQCDQCQRWMSKKNIKEHMATHTNERLYPCTVCKKTFKVKRTAHRHIQNHINAQNKQRKCYDCDQVFESESSIPEHYRLEHQHLTPYNCLICGKGFYQKRDLGDHSHTHSDEERRRMSIQNPVEHYQLGNARVYECTLCRRAFSTKRATVAHFIVHTDRTFVCEHCHMSFRVKMTLEDHLMDVHKVKS